MRLPQQIQEVIRTLKDSFLENGPSKENLRVFLQDLDTLEAELEESSKYLKENGYVTMADVLRQALWEWPNAAIYEDDDGQLVIYTGFFAGVYEGYYYNRDEK